MSGASAGARVVQLGHQRAQLLGRLDVAGEEHDAPDAPGADQRGEIVRQRRAGEAGEQELPRLPREATRTPYPSWPRRRGALARVELRRAEIARLLACCAP